MKWLRRLYIKYIVRPLPVSAHALNIIVEQAKFCVSYKPPLISITGKTYHPLSLLTGWDMVLFVLWMIVSGVGIIGILLLVW